MVDRPKDREDLAQWLEQGYARSFRTACLLLGNRNDAEDAVQEAYLRAWRFRASLQNTSNLSPWLYRVVVNTCCSKLRDQVRRRERRSEASQLEDVASPCPSPEEMAGRADVTESVLGALNDLPLHLRVAIVLRYYADLTEREIAIAIGRRPGTVKSRLHEGRRLLATHPGLQALVSDQDYSVEETRL